MASVLFLCPGFVLASPLSWLKLSNAAFRQCGSDRLFSVFSVGKWQNQGKKRPNMWSQPDFTWLILGEGVYRMWERLRAK